MQNYLKKTLKNGVKLYLYPDPKMQRFYVDYSVNYGSSGKYYKFYYNNKLVEVLPGIAHFLEHMLGEHSKYGNMYKIFSDKKYQKNGITYGELTRFYFCGLNDIKESIKILINTIDDPVFTKEDVEKTKPAIIEETKLSLNNKYRKSVALCSKNLYKNVEMEHESLSQIGTAETTRAIDYDTLKLCYDAFYYDENKTLLIAGNFNPDEMTKYVESIYQELKPHPNKMKPFNYHNLDKVKKPFDVIYENVSEKLVTIGFKQINKLNLPRREIATYINYLFYTKLLEETDFVDNLKKDRIIAYIGAKWYTFFDDKHFNILIGASVKDYDEYLSRLFKELKINNFKEEDFNRYMKSKIADEAGKIDYKYEVFDGFKVSLPYTEDFSEIEFFKTLTFKKFLKFYQTLTFDNYTIALVEDKNN